MLTSKEVTLRQVALPEFGVREELPAIAQAEYLERCQLVHATSRCDWVVVYGDREHFANIAFLSGFDPRFEEALLLLGPLGSSVLVVGNEGHDLARIAPLGGEVELCQEFSLMGQSRDEAPSLSGVLEARGISGDSRVGVGWKYLEDASGMRPSFVPAYVLDSLTAAGVSDVRDVTGVLMDPGHGLRLRNSADQLAQFEWGAARASSSVLKILRAAQPGMTERAACRAMDYAGEPLSVHPMLASGKGPIVGLRSAGSRTIEHGDGITVAIGFWGGLTCRAGTMSEQLEEEYLQSVVVPYFQAIVAWYESIRIGQAGGHVVEVVTRCLREAGLSSMLTPGHVISLDEWTTLSMRPNSADKLPSGVTLQCDIIPRPMHQGRALNCEDTIALADDELRAELADRHPAVWRRIEVRRTFMQAELGIELSPDVLPLSSCPAYFPPAWLDDTLVCVAS